MRIGRWYHICIVGAEARLYVDGLRVPRSIWGYVIPEFGASSDGTLMAWIKPTAFAFKLWYWAAHELAGLWRMFWGEADTTSAAAESQSADKDGGA